MRATCAEPDGTGTGSAANSRAKDGSVPAAGTRDSVHLLLLRTPISKYVRARNRS